MPGFLFVGSVGAAAGHAVGAKKKPRIAAGLRYDVLLVKMAEWTGHSAKCPTTAPPLGFHARTPANSVAKDVSNSLCVSLSQEQDRHQTGPEHLRGGASHDQPANF